MNKFTLILHNKGWTVKDAIARWGIDYSTYNRRCNNNRMHQQLEDMCNGLPTQETAYGVMDYLKQTFNGE